METFLVQFAKIYKIVAPIDKEPTANKTPNHFPNIKPAANKIGLAKPKVKTQIIVKIKNANNNKIVLVCLILAKYSLLA